MSFLSRLFQRGPSTSLSAAEFVEQRTDDAAVVDVRTPREYQAGHLAGAVNADVTAPDFRAQVEALGLPTDEPVYLYCRSGSRSGRATTILREMGYDAAYNVGGLDALRAAGA